MNSSSKTIEAKSNPNQPIRCLVIQLARLGDTLQSLMALRAAKQLYPNLEIHFVAREKFSDAAKRVPWISSVVTLPTDDLFGPLFSGQKTEQDLLVDLAQWIKPLAHQPWDFIVNWSFSEASSYLTAILPSRVKLGYTRRTDGTFSGADGWSQYIQAIVQGDVPQNIHLTDILTTQLLTALQIHIGEAAPNGNAPVTSKTFFSLTLNEREISQISADFKKKWISIQLGAGKAEKTWNPESWAHFTFKILRNHSDWGVFVLGGKDDQERERQFWKSLQTISESQSESPDTFQQIKKSIASFVGEASFDLWASLISRSQWLVAGDTAAIHLASLLGTRVLNLSIGPVRFTETGPYGNGHYVLSPTQLCPACTTRQAGLAHTCADSISPEITYAVWSYASAEWIHRREISLESHFEQLNRVELGQKILVNRSKIRPTEEGGGVVFESILKRPLRVDEWSAMVMGHVARTWYCGWVPSIGNEIQRGLVSPPLVKHLRELEESTEVLAKVCSQAILIGNSLFHKGAHLKSSHVMSLQEKEELQDLGTKLLELQKLIERVGQTHPVLSAFSKMLAVQMHHLKGNHLGEMGKESAQCYQVLREGVMIFSSWIKHTLELVKPIAIRPSHLTLINTHENPNAGMESKDRETTL